MAVDPGSVRIGVARSDPAATLAVPVTTVRRGAGDLTRIAELIVEHEAREVVVGFPASLHGGEGPAARRTRRFARELAGVVSPIPVRLVDERLTTVTAEAQLRAGASTGKIGARGGRARRAVVDQAAAVVLLQGALDTEKTTGSPPGEVVAPAS
ncbi:Holliday junction resolvase RuvX [Lipingzhangella sp. LS1_29]|uniref:Putative pre-16S rRNA nuclease n=1 Tax=Lipingzhangella rawalii TaxID=2055835 RepID=A0ABU2H7T5_9ACTN|nr:Holliday junction resolvase RuvX [Lipingzhangella rawalii]MDS1271373.1 Holliday junction resolvase RuvX [Lipingzhangella rawalii]